MPAVTYAGAKRAAEAVAAECTKRGVAPVCAVVDAGGELVYLWRPEEAQVASVGVATDKARTAAIYRRPSKDFEEQAAGGRASALHLARAVPLQGGIPIVHEGEVIGAVGVSGASSADEDQELAVLGSEALAEPAGSSNGASFFGNEAVRAKFATGGLLLDAGAYKLDAGRRNAPGEVEYHAHTVDVMHIVEGNATVRDRRRDGRRPQRRRRRAARRVVSTAGTHTSSRPATCWPSRRASHTSSPRSLTRSCTSS